MTDDPSSDYAAGFRAGEADFRARVVEFLDSMAASAHTTPLGKTPNLTRRERSIAEEVTIAVVQRITDQLSEKIHAWPPGKPKKS